MWFIIGSVVLVLFAASLMRLKLAKREARNQYRPVRKASSSPAHAVRRHKGKAAPARQVQSTDKPADSTVSWSAPLDGMDVLLGLTEDDAASEGNLESAVPMLSEAEQPNLSITPPKAPLVAYYLMADADTPFLGYALLQAMLSAGLRYGQKHIFHRYTQRAGGGQILFSVASAEAPGSFDLSNMGAVNTTGLALFFEAGELEDPVFVYDLLIKTIDQLVNDLGGEVLDMAYMPLTSERVLAERVALKDYMNQVSHRTDLFESVDE
jgi:cell division protein ZipA